MTLEVYHLRLSQSERITWLLEELELPYELHILDRDPTSALAPPQLKQINPAGTAPFFRDSTVQPPVTLGESGAIVQYILSVHAPKSKSHVRLERQPGDPDYADYLSYFHSANATLQAAIGRSMTINIAKIADTPLGHRFNSKLDGLIEMLDDRLAQSKWLAGSEVSAADVMTVFSLTTMRGFCPIKLSPYPNVLRWLKDASERPAYKRAMEKGDPDLKPMIEAEVQPFNQFEALRQK